MNKQQMKLAHYGSTINDVVEQIQAIQDGTIVRTVAKSN